MKVIIHKQAGDAGKHPVKISANGRMILIKQGEEVAIPKAYVDILRNAKEKHFDYDDEGHLRERIVDRWPFSIIG